jgi:hypothetical protein
MMNHPLAHSPTMTDSLREWLSTFEGLNDTALNLEVSEIYTILPTLMNRIDPQIFQLGESIP